MVPAMRGGKTFYPLPAMPNRFIDRMTLTWFQVAPPRGVLMPRSAGGMRTFPAVSGCAERDYVTGDDIDKYRPKPSQDSQADPDAHPGPPRDRAKDSTASALAPLQRITADLFKWNRPLCDLEGGPLLRRYRTPIGPFDFWVYGLMLPKIGNLQRKC
jgi:hypothetical protein